ncbi:hypothetical protein QJV49_00810 [Lactococcus sp. NH2-7C]|nr:hypothetical protein [Lactococcus sp. NH2-7C]WGV30553.1 hypothetical protein QJV49_00810 [Lactococcus sp. NH2-7C]
MRKRSGMINEKEWKKSFKNINGRLPNENEYREAISNGLLREPNQPNSDKKTIIIVGAILGGLLVVIIAILLTIFFYPKPAEPQSSFNSNSTQSSISSIETDSKKDSLFTWSNLNLNEQIALIAQAYAGLNPQTTILSADKISMTANGNKGVNDGFIQWYDQNHKLHKLNVLISDENVNYDYLSSAGQAEKKSTKISKMISNYYETDSMKEETETVTSKMVTPADLLTSDPIGFVQNNIVGKGFIRQIKSYDGMNPDRAMKNGGPQNLIHDGVEYYYFTDNNSVKLTGLGTYVSSAKHSYRITDRSITIDGVGYQKTTLAEIPYKIENGEVFFEDESINYEAHTYIYSFREDSKAKDYIDSKKESN